MKTKSRTSQFQRLTVALDVKTEGQTEDLKEDAVSEWSEVQGWADVEVQRRAMEAVQLRDRGDSLVIAYYYVCSQ